MATPRPKYVNCLVPPSAKQARLCYFLMKVSLASLKMQGESPDIGAFLAQLVARPSHNLVLVVHEVKYLKVVSSTHTRCIYLFNPPKALNGHEMKVKITQALPS